MNITKAQLVELTELIEDGTEYFCDQEKMSGELAWTVIQCLATAKLAEMAGELAAAWKMETVKLADLFMHFMEQLIIQHECKDPLRAYQLVADRCQAEVNRISANDPDRNR